MRRLLLCRRKVLRVDQEMQIMLQSSDQSQEKVDALGTPPPVRRYCHGSGGDLFDLFSGTCIRCRVFILDTPTYMIIRSKYLEGS